MGVEFFAVNSERKEVLNLYKGNWEECSLGGEYDNIDLESLARTLELNIMNGWNEESNKKSAMAKAKKLVAFSQGGGFKVYADCYDLPFEGKLLRTRMKKADKEALLKEFPQEELYKEVSLSSISTKGITLPRDEWGY